MNEIITRFPRFELSYEKKSHKKIRSSLNQLYIAIPFGKKYFIWFTYFENKNVCLLIEIDRYKNEYTIKGTYPVYASFHSSLSLGTVGYGTIVTQNGIKIFVLENMYYYKGKNVSQYIMSKKMKIFSLFFQHDIKQNIYHRSQLLFTLPIHHTNYTSYLKEMPKAYYRIYATQTRLLEKYDTFYNYDPNHDTYKDEKIFMIKPSVQNDIYELYCNTKEKQLHQIGIACVNSYKTSILLNKLFRNIKENENLDALELSDTEDEFENVDEDKFVYLDRAYPMKCVYRHKFKAWEPVAKIDDPDTICYLDDL